MPIIHSSPHPINDLNVDWNPKEDLMGNPYPNVGRGFEPGYDQEQWAGGERLAGRDRHHRSMPHGPVLEHASQFDTGRRGVHVNHHHRQAFSSDGRYPPHPHARFNTESDEEEEEEGEYFGGEDFEYDPYDDEEEPVFPPRMGPGRDRAWDSSDGEEDRGRRSEFDEEEDYEEEDSDSYAADVRANMRQHNRGPMPRRGHPHQHQGGMRQSSPPPLESPPGSPPPPLSRGMPFHRGMDPRMMRGRGGMMGGQGMSARMRNRGGGVPIPVRGGPPHAHGMPMHSGRVPMDRAHFPASPSSSADSWAFRHGTARVRQGSHGGNFKKAIRWLKPNSTPIKLNHSLRAGTFLNPAARTLWDVRQLPVTVRPGVPVGFGRATFAEPASSPPVGYMRLLVHIPGLGGDQWTVDVWPSGSPYSPVYPTLPSPYSFAGSPNVLSMSPFQPVGFGPPPPFVRCADVLHALYTMLQRRARADEFHALDPRRAERVGTTFWTRCQAIGAAAPPPLQQEELNRNVNSGVKRIDFLVRKTRWEGLEPGDADDEWIVRLGHI